MIDWPFDTPLSEVRARVAIAVKLAAIVAGLVIVLVAAKPGYPSVHIFTGSALVLGLLLVAGLPSVDSFCARAFAVLDRISLAANLKEDIDLPREARRINLLRIAIGAVFLWRWFWLLPLALVIQHDVYSVFTALTVVLTGVCLMVGFFTPIASIVLLLGAIWSFDFCFSAATLGTHVLVMANIPLLFFSAGTALSIDARLMKSDGALGATLRGMYGLFGAPSMARSRVGRLLTAVSYGALCLYSILMHLKDPAWLSGYANVQIMSSFYLSRYPEFFQWLYETHPSFMILLSRTSIYLIMVWEFCFFGFLFFKFTRYYVLWIGVVFFVISGFILQLSYLPWVEFCLFALVFWQGWGLNVDGRRSISIFFDDRCRLCDGTMRFLSWVDLFGIVRPMGLSRSMPEIVSAGLTEDQVMHDLCGRAERSGKIYRGYDLYLELSRLLVTLTPVWPLLLFGKLIGLGPLVYRAIAARRRRIFGTCTASTITVDDFRPAHVVDIAHIPARTIWPSAFVLVYLSLFACYALGTLPFGERFWLRYPSTVRMHLASYNFGLVPINVFNKQDLGMENNFATLEGRRTGSSERVILPYLDRNGRRLAWNRSDRFYFGNSLALRRSMVDYRNYCFLDPKAHVPLFRSLLELASSEGYSAPYEITYYSIPDWDYAHMPDPAHKSFVPYKVCELTLDQDGTVQKRVEFVPVNIPRTD